MPKIVDPDERRRLIADAVFALVERGGIEEASLRNVAAQADLSVGSVRHYVDGHEGMLITAVHEMSARVERRIRRRIKRLDGSDDPAALLDAGLDVLEELLPLDAERRREVVVWLAFCERARIAPTLAHEARSLIDGARQVARPLLAAAGLTPPALDLATESLAALVDGLAIALLHDPDRLDREQVRDILRGALLAGLGRV